MRYLILNEYFTLGNKFPELLLEFISNIPNIFFVNNDPDDSHTATTCKHTTVPCAHHLGRNWAVTLDLAKRFFC